MIDKFFNSLLIALGTLLGALLVFYILIAVYAYPPLLVPIALSGLVGIIHYCNSKN